MPYHFCRSSSKNNAIVKLKTLLNYKCKSIIYNRFGETEMSIIKKAFLKAFLIQKVAVKIILYLLLYLNLDLCAYIYFYATYMYIILYTSHLKL